MASASSLPCEEQLLCSICLDVFTEPVSTPCGHNYCKTCITGYWSSSDRIQCPLCKKMFRKKTQLQVNTGFRDMVEHFNKMRMSWEDDAPATPGEVTCDICLEPKLRAQKTCLVCLASYCQSHLEPHQRVQTLKKHQLIEPVSNLEDRVCKKHDKMFELFCREDQKCVCFMCLKDNHATHEAVPLEQAFRERKDQLEYVITELETIENTKSWNIRGIMSLVEQSKINSEKEIAEITAVFAALVASLQRSQAELIEVIQEKQKAARKEAEDRLTQLEQEVAELRGKILKIEELIQIEDPICFLQSCPVFPYSHTEQEVAELRRSEMKQPSQSEEDLSFGQSQSQSVHFPYTEGVFDPQPQSTPFKPDLPDISQQNYGAVMQNAVAQMVKTLSYQMQVLLQEVRCDGSEVTEKPDATEELMMDGFVKEVWTPSQYKLMMVQQYDKVDVTLDTYTAHPRLVVSEDGKQLTFGKYPLSLPTPFGRRFVRQPFIFGKEGFSSDSFYYEVRVSGSKGWVLGVAKESLVRDSAFFPTPEDGAWTLCGIYKKFHNHDYLPNGFSKATLCVRQEHMTIGVFVDYEKAEVSFYDVDTRTLIYSYTGCTFTETIPALRAFLYSVAGTPIDRRPKLYPVFGIFEGDYDSKLVITHVARNIYKLPVSLYQWPTMFNF